LAICRGFVEALGGWIVARHKLEPDPARPIHILTELGVGYRLQLPPEQRAN